MIDTGALTTKVIERFAAHGLLIGDGVAPTAGGWSEGQPNVDRFVAYSTVSFDGAVPALPDLTIKPDWEALFSVRHFGGARKQCDFQATATRGVIDDLRRMTVGDFTVIAVTWKSLGAMTRVDQTDPPYWQAFDLVALVCSQ